MAKTLGLGVGWVSWSGCMGRVGVQVVLGSPFRYPGRKGRGQVVSRRPRRWTQ